MFGPCYPTSHIQENVFNSCALTVPKAALRDSINWTVTNGIPEESGKVFFYDCILSNSHPLSNGRHCISELLALL